MGGALPKQYQELGGRIVLEHTWLQFADHPRIDQVWTVIHPEEEARARAILPPGAKLVHGGATRDASVALGLAALGPETTHVLIHDGARATVPAVVIDRVIDALARAPGAAPALPVADALWRGQDGAVTGTTPRDDLFRAQTPQGFDLAVIRAAHAARQASDGPAADDVEVARAAGHRVQIVPGHEDNIKLTYPEDRARAERVLYGRMAQDQKGHSMEIRLGNGYDVHRFRDGDHVTLCGVTVPHDKALEGHSDADVGMHAVTDAIYGALALGDIGRHFPPSDPQWKGADSAIFLRHATQQVAERGLKIGNIDCTLVCERPKIGPHAEAMRARMAQILEIDIDRVSIKATTSERLGFTGREEGIAALATVTLVGA